MQTITKEQRRALEVVCENIPHLHSLQVHYDRVRGDAPLLSTNFVAASIIPFFNVNLPHCLNWFWNQSNAKITVVIDDTTTILLKKICTKRFNSQVPLPPSHKIWIYEIERKDTETWFFLWCEKGVEGGIETEIGTIFPESISLASLAFLSPFLTDKTIAKELGWCFHF